MSLRHFLRSEPRVISEEQWMVEERKRLGLPSLEPWVSDKYGRLRPKYEPLRLFVVDRAGNTRIEWQ